MKLERIANNKAQNTTPKVVSVAMQMEICKGRSTKTQTKLIPTQTIATQANFHAELVDAAIQMEGWSSHNKEVQTEEISSHSIGTQIEEQAKDILSSKDIILLKLQEELMQAQLALERCEQESLYAKGSRVAEIV